MPQAPDFGQDADELRLAFLASPTAVRENLVRMLVMQPLSGLSDEARSTAELVLAEVLNNVAEHAYAEQPGPVTVTLRRLARGIGCQVIDQGTAMPGGQLPEGRLPDTSLDALEAGLEDLPEGGFGWHLIRALTQDLGYQRIDGSNRLCFLLPLNG